MRNLNDGAVAAEGSISSAIGTGQTKVGTGPNTNLATQIPRIEVGATVLRTAIDNEILAGEKFNDGATAAQTSISGALATGQILATQTGAGVAIAAPDDLTAIRNSVASLVGILEGWRFQVPATIDWGQYETGIPITTIEDGINRIKAALNLT